MKTVNKLKKKMKKWVKTDDHDINFARAISLISIIVLLSLAIFSMFLFWVDQTFGLENIAMMLKDYLAFLFQAMEERFEVIVA